MIEWSLRDFSLQCLRPGPLCTLHRNPRQQKWPPLPARPVLWALSPLWPARRCPLVSQPLRSGASRMGPTAS